MPNYLGQTPYGHLVEDDAGAMFHLPDAPTWGTPAPEPVAPEPAPMPVAAPQPLTGPDVVGAPVQVTPAEAAPVPQPKPAPVRKPAAPTFESAYQDQAASLDESMQAAAAKAELDVAHAEETDKLLRSRNDAIKAQRVAAEAEQMRMAKTRELAQQDVEHAIGDWQNKKVESGRKWNSLSTGGKWGLVLSLVASGWANANTGKLGQNPALDIWMKAVDEDMALQRDEKNSALQNVGLAKERVAGIDRLSGDLQARRAAQMAATLEDSAREVEVLANKMRPGQAQANLLAYAADLRAKRGEFAMVAADKIADDRNRRAQIWLGTENLKENRRQFDSKLAFDIAQFEASKQAEAAKLAQAGKAEEAKRVGEAGVPDLKDVDGGMYVARNAKAAEDVARKFASTSDVTQVIDEMMALKKKYGAELWGKAGAEMDALGGLLASKLRQAQDMGTLDNGAIKALNTQMGIKDGSSFSEGDIKTFITRGFGIGSDNATSVLENLRRIQVDSFNNTASALRSPIGGKFAPQTFEGLSKPTVTTPTEDLGEKLGKGSEGGRGYIDAGGREISKQVYDMVGGLVGGTRLPASKANYETIKGIFDIAKANTPNSGKALADLSFIASNPKLDDDTRRTASMALSAIRAGASDLDLILNESLASDAGVNTSHPDTEALLNKMRPRK